MSRKKFRLKYSHSKFWLIFWIIAFFPIGLVLLLSHTEVISASYKVKAVYDGDRFWLFFWAFIFFPIAILLGLFKGSIIVDQ
jgi:hypothetical protein